MKKLGKQTVEVKKDQTGYLANRLTATVWREASNTSLPNIFDYVDREVGLMPLFSLFYRG
jgi:3-hydroxyacyl-CoA dehydrogenase